MFGCRSSFPEWGFVQLSDALCPSLPKHEPVVRPRTCSSKQGTRAGNKARTTHFIQSPEQRANVSSRLVKSSVSRHPRNVLSPLKQESDEEQAQGTWQNGVKLRGGSRGEAFAVGQIHPGEVPWQPQTLPPQPLGDCLQHAAQKQHAGPQAERLLRQKPVLDHRAHPHDFTLHFVPQHDTDTT